METNLQLAKDNIARLMFEVMLEMLVTKKTKSLKPLNLDLSEEQRKCY